MAQLILNHLTKDFGVKGAEQVRPAVSTCRWRCASRGFSALARAFRLWQDDGAPDDRRLRAAERTARSSSGERRLSDAARVLAAGEAQWQMVFQSYALCRI